MSKKITKLYDEARELALDPNAEIIRIPVTARRTRVINALQDKIRELRDTQAKLEEALRDVQRVQNEERERMDAAAGVKTTSSPTTTARQQSYAEVVRPNTQEEIRQVTTSLHLRAVPVRTFGEVRGDGRLYYVTSAQHYAFIIADHLFHGNIGVIYTGKQNPEKVKDCKYGGTCSKKGGCDYYHDPMTCPGSTDKRNFVSNAWVYSPNDSNPHARKFGSLTSLDVDIANMSQESITCFCDQAMHDILCAIVLREASKH